MKSGRNNISTNSFSRRDFLKSSAATAASLAALSATQMRAYAAGSDKLRVGLIGCGGRGTGAAKDCVHSSEGVEITALADLFEDHLRNSLNDLQNEVPDRLAVTEENCFVGFDAFKKLIATDVDMVILGTPPHFRPEHLDAAINAGKHVFMEKPVAVDPVGARSIIASAELAEKKGLGIVAGTQRRHQDSYIELIKRIHAGDIGELVAAQCYWNMGELWVKEKRPEWTDMEWQVRNWLYFTWLSGDHIVEQHVHNLDVVNWAFGTHPKKAMGMGGRQVRTGEEYGNVFDHFAIEYEYPGDIRVLSMCRQTAGCANRISERIVGTKGAAYSHGEITGANPYTYDGPNRNPYVQEHADLIASIRAGNPLNEGRRIAESTLTAIMGRMSAYTGRALSWDWVMNASKLDLRPEKYEFGSLPVRPVAMPGKTELI